LFAREVVPFYLSLLALALATLAIDAALHLADLVWVGKWLGIPGLALICGSFGYSLRKRKLISRGQRLARLDGNLGDAAECGQWSDRQVLAAARAPAAYRKIRPVAR
jgi:hypothetical protein